MLEKTLSEFKEKINNRLESILNDESDLSPFNNMFSLIPMGIYEFKRIRYNLFKYHQIELTVENGIISYSKENLKIELSQYLFNSLIFNLKPFEQRLKRHTQFITLKQLNFLISKLKQSENKDLINAILFQISNLIFHKKDLILIPYNDLFDILIQYKTHFGMIKPKKQIGDFYSNKMFNLLKELQKFVFTNKESKTYWDFKTKIRRIK